MAVNLLPSSSWTTKSETSTIKITTDQKSVHFNMGSKLTDEMAYAKAYVAVNVSGYKTITLKYSAVSGDGISSISFGAFSSTTASSDSGVGITNITSKTGGGTVTLDVSSKTGTYYIGFQFYGNSYTLNENVGWSIQRKVTITSLQGVENVYTVSYNANGGSGTTSSHTNITPGNSVTLRANGFTAPTSAVWTLSGLNANGGASIKATFSSNSFYRWRTGTTSGTYRDPGYVFTPTANTTFYAQWKTTYTITATKNSYREAGLLVTYNANGGICPLKNDRSQNDQISYEFQGVNTDKNATTGNKTITITANDSTTRYAIWKSVRTPNAITLPTATKSSTYLTNTITLNLNGGKWTSSDPKGLQSTAEVSYTLSGWYDGSTRVGTAKDSYKTTTTKTLTAQYTSTTSKFSTVKLPDSLKRYGYKFIGWNTTSNATTGFTSYTPTSAGSTTLYAIWEPEKVIHINTGNDFKLAKVYVRQKNEQTNEWKWVQVIPWINDKNNQGWTKIKLLE